MQKSLGGALVSKKVEDIRTFCILYKEPCNNCEHYEDGILCALGHRQKKIAIEQGHIPELTYRRSGGCPDWTILTSKTDAWWHEEPLYPCSVVYGGTKTNILG